MGQILRMDAAAVIEHNNLDDGSEGPPFYTDRASLPGMVERVFHEIADRFHQPGAVAEEGDCIIPGQGEDLSLLPGPPGKMFFDTAHHVGDIFIRLFKEDGSRIQLCDFQKILHEVPDPVKLMLGKLRKFPDFRRICRLRLQDSVIDIQSGKGSFQLVGDVGNGILQEAFRLRLILRVGVQDGNQRIDLMEQTVQPALFIAGDPGVLISRKIISDLRGGFLHEPVLFPKIQIQERKDGKHGPCAGE